MIHLLEVVMGSKWYQNKLKTSVALILIIFSVFLIPSFIWSAGFQEEKLFDGDFYSPVDSILNIDGFRPLLTNWCTILAALVAPSSKFDGYFLFFIGTVSA